MDLAAAPIDLTTPGRVGVEPSAGALGDDALARALASIPSAPSQTIATGPLLPPPIPAFDPAPDRSDPQVAAGASIDPPVLAPPPPPGEHVASMHPQQVPPAPTPPAPPPAPRLVHDSSAVPGVAAGTAELDPAEHLQVEHLHAELVRTALELAQLAEHHRRELSDTMAELTRLQRQVRAETRGAIEELRRLAAAESARADGAAQVEGTAQVTDPESSTAPTRRGLRGRLRLSRS